MNNFLFEGPDWSFDLLKKVDNELEPLCKKYSLDIYPNQIEIISAEQMLDNYSSVGLPLGYHHWSFGKEFISLEKEYKKGNMGLAYELVINSNPCINYLMEENTMGMQTLVMLHAGIGHNCFSDDTEILTALGWRGREGIATGDSIATLNPISGEIEWQSVSKKFEYDYNGDMCWFKNSISDHLVTPNHNMVYYSGFTKELIFKEARQWTNKSTFAVCAGVGNTVSENTNYTDNELRLLVQLVTDGSIEYLATGYCRWHLKKQRKIDRLVSLLQSMDLPFKLSHTNKKTIKISTYLDTTKFTKSLPSNFSLSKRQFEIFIEEWINTDGSIRGTKNIKNVAISGLLCSNKKEHVDLIQKLAVLCGAKTSYRVDKRTGVYTVDIRTNKDRVQLVNTPLTNIIKYSGKIWCVEVDNHTIVSRRNGRVLITGNSFFRNNYLFKTWTDATSIIDYLVFAKSYIAQCEENYGKEQVELILDSCHALMNYGVDRYKHPKKLSMEKERDLQKERETYLQSQVNELWRTIPKKEKVSHDLTFPESPEENILYFIEKNAPNLESWHREIIRIVRKIAQYFYPQRQTKLSNEGWATFWHYTLLYDLYDQGKLTDGTMLEVLMSHSGVVRQAPMHPINPYALGFAMFKDIKSICENPTEGDKKEFPDIAGSNWIKTLDYIMRNYRDESFVSQFLSERVIRDQKLFSILDNHSKDKYMVTAIHNDDGYKTVRQLLSNQYNQSEPNIQVYKVNRMTDRSLVLRHYRERNRPLNSNTEEVLKHVNRLWGFPVRLETVGENGLLDNSKHFNLEIE